MCMLQYITKVVYKILILHFHADIVCVIQLSVINLRIRELGTPLKSLSAPQGTLMTPTSLTWPIPVLINMFTALKGS